LFMFLKKKKFCGKFEKNKQLNKWNDSTFEFRKFPHSKIRIPFIESLLPRCSSENFKDKTQLKFSNVHFFRFKFFFIDEDSFYTHPTPQHADLLQQWKVSLSVRVCLSVCVCPFIPPLLIEWHVSVNGPRPITKIPDFLKENYPFVV
jgi:hypothetical protein